MPRDVRNGRRSARVGDFSIGPRVEGGAGRADLGNKRSADRPHNGDCNVDGTQERVS